MFSLLVISNTDIALGLISEDPRFGLAIEDLCLRFFDATAKDRKPFQPADEVLLTKDTNAVGKYVGRFNAAAQAEIIIPPQSLLLKIEDKRVLELEDMTGQEIQKEIKFIGEREGKYIDHFSPFHPLLNNTMDVEWVAVFTDEKTVSFWEQDDPDRPRLQP